MIVKAAIQEAVDAIGISCHASNYSQIEELMDLLKKENMSDILVVCGGNIPKNQIARLKRKGVAEVFTPHSTSDAITDFIRSNVNRDYAYAATSE